LQRSGFVVDGLVDGFAEIRGYVMKLASGQVAVVTGAASGIGFALTEALCKRGLSVMLADVENGALEEAHGRLTRAGFDVRSHLTDVADPAAVHRLADAMVKQFGQVDLLVNNAGVGGGLGPIWASDPKDWTWAIGVNLFGVVNGLQAMLARGRGHVVNVASLAGLTSPPFLSAYVASKHAVVGLSESLAVELASVGSSIKVSVVCPGGVQSRIFESERNRPPHLQAISKTPPEILARIRSAFAARMANPMPAMELADKVIAGVERDEFYILTHREHDDGVLARLARVESAVRQREATASS
jgi:NAD(P)-dependent dehydrogenase (short-subunit alcohol dehydrogenase family)